MQQTGARTKRGRANDERILDAALEVAYAMGIDGFGLKDVAAAAKLTTGALYGRYESVGELQAELWQQRLVAEVDALLGSVRSALDSDFAASDCKALLQTTHASAVALFSCAVSPRTDELGDVVADDLRALLSKHRLQPGLASDFDVSVLALVIGIHLHSQREGNRQKLDTAALRTLAGTPRSLRGSAPHATQPGEIRFDLPDDSSREALVNALAKVVARSGLSKATVRRVARAAGSSHTAVYATYGSLHGLVEDFVKVVGHSSPAPSEVARRFLSSDVYTGILRTYASPAGNSHRRLSIEFLIGVSPRPELAKIVSDFDAKHYEAAAAVFAKRGTDKFQAFIRLAHVIRAATFGMVVLQDTVGGLEDEDWRPLFSPFVKQATS